MTLWNTGPSRSQRTKQYQWKLDQTGSVTLDANGNGQFQLAPGGAREKWTINYVSVTMTNTIPNSVKVAQMVMYRSSAQPGNQLSGTSFANMDADSQSVYAFNMGEPAVFLFSGGDPGSIGTVHIEGIRYVWE
jgi:hypothetical protein